MQVYQEFSSSQSHKHIESCLQLFTSLRRYLDTFSLCESVSKCSMWLQILQHTYSLLLLYNSWKTPHVIVSEEFSLTNQALTRYKHNTAWSRDSFSITQPSLLTQKEAFLTECQALLTQMQDVACCPFSGFIKHGIIPE